MLYVTAKHEQVDQLNEKINQLELDLTATETSRGSLEDQVSMMVENIENLGLVKIKL